MDGGRHDDDDARARARVRVTASVSALSRDRVSRVSPLAGVCAHVLLAF